MDATSIFGFPFAESTDAADMPALSQAMADRAEEVAAAGIRSSGKSIIATEQTTTSSTYAELGTPDRVEDIVLPTDGLLLIGFQAQAFGPSGSKAAVFIGANQLKLEPSGGGTPAVQEAALPTNYGPLYSTPSGLTAQSSGGGVVDPVTTGQILGAGFIAVFAAAGTYDVSVQFKRTSGAVTVKNRRLYVASLAFGMPPP